MALIWSTFGWGSCPVDEGYYINQIPLLNGRNSISLSSKDLLSSVWVRIKGAVRYGLTEDHQDSQLSVCFSLHCLPHHWRWAACLWTSIFDEVVVLPDLEPSSTITAKTREKSFLSVLADAPEGKCLSCSNPELTAGLSHWWGLIGTSELRRQGGCFYNHGKKHFGHPKP